MRNSDIINNWPGNIQDAEELHMLSFDEWDEKYMDYNGIVVVTDGWKEGTAACVLRGGVNAVAVLELLSMSGFKRVKIYHMEEKLTQLEDIFTSTVMEYANAHFDNVNVVWRKESTLDQLLSIIGEEHSMLLFGAPLTPSELPKFHERVRKCYSGSVTLVRGPMMDIEIDSHDKMLKWVKERTYEASDFSLPGVLRSYKKQSGMKVAVILPALNEEETVGNVIKMALEVKHAGIIDEIILIDSDSADKTVSIAETYGIPVFRHSEIRPDLGSYQGKGEAMYKSYYTTDADIIAWVDTDISSITPEFFYGLLGPLLSNPDIRFSKGYFSRPVRVEASGLELGGGRVTEILARPLINTFMPELSGFIQPLAGTVAIYREDFMKMKVPVNYGVEIAMLIQAVETAGIWGTAQVNLGNVIHRSKDVMGLGEMAFQILQVLGQMGAIQSKGETDNVMRHVYSAHGHFEIISKRFSTVWREFK